MRERDESGQRRGMGCVRWGLLGLFSLILAIGSLAVWRVSSLSGLPDIGDPFDVASVLAIQVPDDENAWTFYKKAGELLTKEPDVSAPSTADPSQSPEILQWLEANREPMRLWLEGSKRERALYTRPELIRIDTLLPGVQTHRSMARYGLYEGAIREAKGDFAGAWEIYRAGLRSSRHCGMNGSLIERLVDIAVHSMFASKIQTWAADPKVDAKLLKQALADTIAAEALTAPSSTYLKVEYLVSIEALNNQREALMKMVSDSTPSNPPGEVTKGLMGLSQFLRREPERSRRVYRLVIANLLAACDLPPAERAKRLKSFNSLTLYDVDRDANPSLHPLSPEELNKWVETSVWARILLPAVAAVDISVRRDEASGAALVVALAEQLALRETGKLPESPESMVGTYLKAIPHGYIPVVGPPEALKSGPPPLSNTRPTPKKP